MAKPRRSRALPHDPDAISGIEAAQVLGLPAWKVQRWRQEGLIVEVRRARGYSRREIEALVSNPWIIGSEAASILGVSRSRVTQLANADRLPVTLKASGERIYRKRQIEVVANARAVRFRSAQLP